MFKIDTATGMLNELIVDSARKIQEGDLFGSYRDLVLIKSILKKLLKKIKKKEKTEKIINEIKILEKRDKKELIPEKILSLYEELFGLLYDKEIIILEQKNWWFFMPKYSNSLMLDFKKGKIDVIYNIDPYLEKAENYKQKLLLLLLFLTGARTRELLELKSSDIYKDSSRQELVIRIITLKRKDKSYRTLPFSIKGKGEISEYAKKVYDLIQYNYLEGQKLFGGYDVFKVRYIIKKLTDNKFIPYFFRHNRHTIIYDLTGDVNMVKYWKGSVDTRSAEVYINMTPSKLRSVSKLMSEI